MSAERSDPRWSPATAKALGQELSPLAQAGGFELRGVECRMTMCVADLDWPDYATAMQHEQELVQHGFAANCARFGATLPSNDPTLHYQSKLIFDCEAWRAEGH
jgi:hypothetical protein